MKVKTCPNCGHRQSHENYVCEYCNYPENEPEPETEE
jgi:ribosomal protein L32